MVIGWWWFRHLDAFFFFCSSVGFELRTLSLLGKCSTSWATPLDLFSLVILEIGSHFLPKLAWTLILLFYASHYTWDDRHVPPCPTFFHWDGVLQTFFLPRLVWNYDPPYLSLPSTLDGRHVPLQPAIGCNGVSQAFCPDWLQTLILLISTSQVDRITGMNHQCQAHLETFDT
jgi:hypothetical protein